MVSVEITEPWNRAGRDTLRLSMWALNIAPTPMGTEEQTFHPWTCPNHLFPMALEPVRDVGTSSPHRAMITGQTKERPKHPKNGPAPVVASQVQIFEKSSFFQSLQKRTLEVLFEKAQPARFSKCSTPNSFYYSQWELSAVKPFWKHSHI